MSMPDFLEAVFVAGSVVAVMLGPVLGMTLGQTMHTRGPALAPSTDGYWRSDSLGHPGRSLRTPEPWGLRFGYNEGGPVRCESG